MKISSIHKTILLQVLLPVFSLTAAICLGQDFQRLYGTNLDNSFSKVIQDGSNYYVLGQDEFNDGTPPAASVTRLDANGNHQWTLSLHISSVWNDAVLTPSGDLLVVGSTLPFDAASKSLMGLVTPTGGGGFAWVRTYDVPGREANTSIVRSPSPQNPAFPYYILGSQFDPNGNSTWDDVILLNINESGTYNWKKIFPSTEDDEFARNLDVMPNGDLILSGNKDNLGVILRLDNSGALIAGAAPDAIQFSYADVTPISGGGFYAVGGTFPSFTAHLFKFDQNLIPIWSSTISGLTSVSQVWEESSSGVIYVVGTGVFNGKSRGVVLLLTVFGQTPNLQWVKFLDNNESAYDGGSISILSANQFAFVDGRSPTSGGFGQQDALMSVHDLQFETCITDEDFVNVNSVTLTYIAPFLPDIDFFDFPTGTEITGESVSWQQEGVCNNSPCNADFNITPIGTCGHYQVTNTSTGAIPLTYLWCDGSTSQDLNVTLPCGPHTFCLTVTDANGCSSSYSESVDVTEIIRPTAICVPGFGVTLDTACQALIVPSMIDGGSTDNCQIQSLSVSPAILTGCGLFPVTLTVTDWCGNTNVCTTNIQTIENVPPVIICPPNQIVTTGNSNCSLQVNGLHWLSVTDNCGGTSFSVTYSVQGATTSTGTGDASGLIFNQGLSTVTYTAMDACGNSGSCSFNVKVECVCNCVNNKLLNPGFYEGAVAGDLGITGNSDHWLRYGTPQVVPGDSCCDDVSIQMFGWLYNGEAMYQQGMNFVAGHHYKISFCGRFVPNNSYGNNVSFGFSAANGYILPFQCTNCETIGNSPQVFSSTWGSYTLPIWTPTQNWDRFYVRTFNTLAQKSWGRIDNICVQEVGQTCCADRDAFVFNIDNAVNFSFEENTQEGICTIGNLPECDSIGFIDWGDGFIDQGPFGGNTIRRHQFLNHLLARIQYPAFEYNTEVDPPAVCFENVFTDSIEVVGSAECLCNSFSEFFMRGSDGSFEQWFECGEPAFALPCLADGSNYDISGSIHCVGQPCAEKTPILWTLTGPSGTYSGTAYGNPYFNISLLPTYFGQAGLYTLSFDGQCGNQSCPCEIQFTIDCLPQCDCTALDVSEFYGRVERGFATLFRENSCAACFIPIALNGCDSVSWHLNSAAEPPIGVSAGRESFCYTFPDAGEYAVIMNVTKKKDDGSKCDKQMRYQQVTPCEPSVVCDQPGLYYPAFDNAGFNEGAQAGGLHSGGMSSGWNSVSGEAEVLEGTEGSLDGWTILLSGNLDTADVLSRAEGSCHDKNYALFSAHVKSGKSNTSDRVNPGVLTVALARSRSFPPNYSIKDKCEDPDCYELASIPLPATDSTEWFDLQIPYNLEGWAAPADSCTGILFAVLVRPILYVTNSFGSNQGAEHTYSYVELDHACFGQGYVAVDDPRQNQDIHIYPNPTNGDLTIELPVSAGNDMVLKAMSITGQVMIEKRADAGTLKQILETKGLGQGMYFLEIVSKTHVLSACKFVKQ